MGIRKKIFLGFVVIGLILFVSGMISLFQLIQIEQTVTTINNIHNIEMSEKIFDEAKIILNDSLCAAYQLLDSLFVSYNNTVLDNTAELKANFYRMVIPLTVAIVVGLFLIILFNYFINFYFINPVLKIIKGIKEYSINKQPYNVKVSTRDEINDLNREIKSLISNTKQKESAGVFNFNK
jgi:methyl-accepting chemotaxis protein